MFLLKYNRIWSAFLFNKYRRCQILPLRTVVFLRSIYRCTWTIQSTEGWLGTVYWHGAARYQSKKAIWTWCVKVGTVVKNDCWSSCRSSRFRIFVAASRESNSKVSGTLLLFENLYLLVIICQICRTREFSYEWDKVCNRPCRCCVLIMLCCMLIFAV